MFRLRADGVYPLIRQESAEKLRDLVEGGQREDVRRGALQHGDVLGDAGRGPAIAGTRVTAVAPLPITTTFLPE